MGDYGNIGINAGYARFETRDYGKVGLEGSLKGDFANDNIGYKLSGSAAGLIGSGHGVNAGAYAGVEFGKQNCTQFNLGVMADYTKAFGDSGYEVANISGNTVTYSTEIDPNQSLKAGLELGFSRNLCCDENRKLSVSLMGGADFYNEAKLNADKGQIEYSKMNKIKPFIGTRAEYAKTVNDKGHQLYFNGKCFLSDGSTYGEAGIGFRF